MEVPFPIDYYSLPFCNTEQISIPNEGIGQLLVGEHISTSPYNITMKRDVYCKRVCTADLDRHYQKLGTQTVPSNKLVRSIQKHYHHNWIVDHLPAHLPADYKLHDHISNSTNYHTGFPIGFVNPTDGLSYIYNHVNIHLQYHAIDSNNDDHQTYRIVGFTVRPFSIAHNAGCDLMAEIKDPIASCNPRTKDAHTEFNTLSQTSHQLSNGCVLFTYDVIWSSNQDLRWSSRWNVYSNNNDAPRRRVHWLFMLSSLGLVLILTVIIAAVLVRILHQNFACYSSVPTEEETTENLIGWKVLHADVFRPPSYPTLISVCCGSGVQILCTSIFTVIFAHFGVLTRRYYLAFVLLLYALMGFCAGYTAARLFKAFKGTGWKKTTTLTAVGFPGIAFTMFFAFNILAMANDSIYIPFFVVLQLMVLWFGVTIPIVFWGAFVGFRQDRAKFPSSVNSIPREIPHRPWYMSQIPAIVCGGFFPFLACYFELFCVMPSLWLDQYYDAFGFFLLTFLILVLTSAGVAVVFTYYQLCLEDYRWWCHSFIVVGSTGIYVFGYSLLFYFQELRGNSILVFVYYFCFMALVSFTITLMVGSVGLLSSLWFTWTIFAFVEREMCHDDVRNSSTGITNVKLTFPP